MNGDFGRFCNYGDMIMKGRIYAKVVLYSFPFLVFSIPISELCPEFELRTYFWRNEVDSQMIRIGV